MVSHNDLPTSESHETNEAAEAGSSHASAPIKVSGKDKVSAVLKKFTTSLQTLSFKNKVILVVGSGLFFLLGITVYSYTHQSKVTASHGGEVAETSEEHSKKENEKAKKHHARVIASYVDQRNLFEKIILAYRDAFVSVQHKVEEIYHLREENVHLRKTNAQLRVALETLQFKQKEDEATEETESKTIQLSKETGSKVGRAVASIEYTWPDNFSKEQLYSLGLLYMKSEEYEKTAKIFSYLSQNGGEDFKSPEMALMTGIALYHIDAFDLADGYFEAILKAKLNAAQKPLLSKARIFRALVNKKKDQNLKAQFWLRDLMEHDPHSKEASYINVIHGGNHGEN